MVLENKRVGFDYTILEEIEAGLDLLGFEVIKRSATSIIAISA